jgi:predicted component of type VI protein secretion system
MPEDRHLHRVVLDVGAGHAPEAPGQPRPDTPFCIALVGDFSGRAHERGAARAPLLVDRDNFDDVLARLAPTVELDLHHRPESGGAALGRRA